MQALDVLTPLAHGCALLAAGSDPVATTVLLLRIASHLHSTPEATQEPTGFSAVQHEEKSECATQLRVVYVAAGCTQDEIDHRVELLRTSGALAHTTVVAAPDTAPLAQQFAALCAGVSIGEHVRDAGGKAVVLLDTAECMVGVWKAAIRLSLGDSPQKDDGAKLLPICAPLR
jgi:F-type H+-transporting ATPase subunit alpha